MVTVKLKEVLAIKNTGSIETKDKKYKVNRSIKKVINYCLKNGFSFKVGFHDTTLIPNKNYIEIYDDWFAYFGEKRHRYCDKSDELKKWLTKWKKK